MYCIRIGINNSSELKALKQTKKKKEVICQGNPDQTAISIQMEHRCLEKQIIYPSVYVTWTF